MSITVFSVLAVKNKDIKKISTFLREHSSTKKQIHIDSNNNFFCDNYDILLESDFNNDLDYYQFKKQTQNKFKIKNFISFQVKN